MSQNGGTVIKGWLFHARKAITFWRQHGFVDGVKNLAQVGELCTGELRGVDKFGNQYWEGKDRTPNRQRWVVYGNRDFDPSQVPAEWHQWLHYMCDEDPVRFPPQPSIFKLAHQQQRLSQFGLSANYLPGGHALRAKPRDLKYEQWEAEKKTVDVTGAPKFAVNSERK